jgi:hypothetical protein
VALPRSGIDHGLYRLLTRRWSEDRRTGHLASLAALDQNATLRLAQASFQTIDAKATGLLTHVSMMIAALGVVAPSIINSMVEGGIVFGEIGIYLLVAIASLRCIALFAPPFALRTQDDTEQWIRRELIIRQSLYGLANRATIWMTALVFVSLPVLYVWHPSVA